MNKNLCRFSFFLTLLLMLAPISLAASLKTIEFATFPGDRVEIQLGFDGEVPEIRSYTIDQPARIAIDLMSTTSLLESKYHTLGEGNAQSVKVLQGGNRTRLIVNLTELVGFESRVEGSRLFVLVGGAAASVANESPEATESEPEVAATPITVEVKKRLTSVDFQRGLQGEGKVVVNLSDPQVPIDVSSVGGRIRVEFIGMELPEILHRRLDVTDFATPVEIVDVLTEAGNAVLYIDPIGEYDYLAYQTDELFIVDVRPLTPQEAERIKSEKFLYSGEKLSLNFQDIPVRTVLQLIADFNNFSLVVSDTVGGNITLLLKNVPWDQALDLILKTKGLDKRLVGNVMRIGPAAEIAAREKLELETQRQIAELAPLRTEFIQVRYAKASDIRALLSVEQGLVSERGSVTVDTRTNTLLVQDTAEKLADIRRVLDVVDIPVRQVLIEARIVTANASFSKALGVRWGLFSADSGAGNGPDGGATDGFRFSDSLGSVRDGAIAADDVIVDLGVSGPGTTTFAVGLFDEGNLLQLELTALESDGQGEVVARPKIITSDKQTATISSGVEIPYAEASASGAAVTAFKNAVLSLEVTPQITPDDRIIMDLNINQDAVGTLAVNGVPTIDTNQITTQVLVDNGQTVVLGGIFTRNEVRTVIKTPFIGDIPYVGKLFSNSSVVEAKQELLIFITPRLISDSLSRR